MLSSSKHMTCSRQKISLFLDTRHCYGSSSTRSCADSICCFLVPSQKDAGYSFLTTDSIAPAAFLSWRLLQSTLSFLTIAGPHCAEDMSVWRRMSRRKLLVSLVSKVLVLAKPVDTEIPVPVAVRYRLGRCSCWVRDSQSCLGMHAMLNAFSPGKLLYSKQQPDVSVQQKAPLASCLPRDYQYSHECKRQRLSEQRPLQTNSSQNDNIVTAEVLEGASVFSLQCLFL